MSFLASLPGGQAQGLTFLGCLCLRQMPALQAENAAQTLGSLEAASGSLVPGCVLHQAPAPPPME